MTKFGLKVGPGVTKEYLNAVRDNADFIEAYAHPDYDYRVLEYWDNPIIFHFPHSDNGTNFANPKKHDLNVLALRHTLQLADKFKAEKIIFHPELFEDDDCTHEVLEQFVKDNYDSRLHLENMPYNCKGVRHIGTSPEEVLYLLEQLGVKFCLDFAHATEYFAKIGADRNSMQTFLDLKPNHFHVTDTDLGKVNDQDFDEQHVAFGEGNMDIEWVKSLIPDNAFVTLETPMDSKRHLSELMQIRS